MKKGVAYLTRTAILLALAVVFQMLRPLFPGISNLFIIGTLVNLVLVVAAGTVGIPGGVAISVIAPVIAFFQGHIKFVWMIPVVAAGNAVIVILYSVFYKKNRLAGALSGSIFKFLVLWILMVKIAVPLAGVKGKMAQLIAFNFGWPQLITALLGCIAAVPVLKSLDKKIMKPNLHS